MKKLLTILLFLISTIVFSQEYPKMIVREGDTLVLITIPQVDSINMTYISLDQYKEMNDSLHSTISSLVTIIDQDEELMKILEERITIKDTIIGEKDNIIEIQDAEIEKKDKKIKRLKIVKIGLAILCIIFAVT